MQQLGREFAPRERGRLPSRLFDICVRNCIACGHCVVANAPRNDGA